MNNRFSLKVGLVKRASGILLKKIYTTHLAKISFWRPQSGLENEIFTLGKFFTSDARSLLKGALSPYGRHAVAKAHGTWAAFSGLESKKFTLS